MCALNSALKPEMALSDSSHSQGRDQNPEWFLSLTLPRLQNPRDTAAQPKPLRFFREKNLSKKHDLFSRLQETVSGASHRPPPPPVAGVW